MTMSKFKVGDLLTSVIVPNKLHVVSVIIEECPGGQQEHYYCRLYSSSGYMAHELIKVNAVEAKLFDEEEYEATNLRPTWQPIATKVKDEQAPNGHQTSGGKSP